MRSSMSPWRARISHGLWLTPLRRRSSSAAPSSSVAVLGLAVPTDDHRRRLEGVSAAPEVAVAAEDLDGLGDERGRVSELIPVVGDDPASFDGVGDAHRRAGRSQELVGFCGESLGLVEIRRQERGDRTAHSRAPSCRHHCGTRRLPAGRARPPWSSRRCPKPRRRRSTWPTRRPVSDPAEHELLGGGRVGFG